MATPNYYSFPHAPDYQPPAQPAAPMMPMTPKGYDPGAVVGGAPLMPITGSFRQRRAELNFRGNQAAAQQDATNQGDYLQSLPKSNDPMVNAGRAALIARDRAKAQAMTPYFQQTANLVNNANTRANDYNAGQVGIFRSVAGVNDANAANTTFQMPYVAALTGSQTGYNNAVTGNINTMTPLQATQMQQQNDLDLKMQPYQVGIAAQNMRGAALGNDVLGIKSRNEDAREKAEIGAVTAQTDETKTLRQELEKERQRSASLMKALAAKGGNNDLDQLLNGNGNGGQGNIPRVTTGGDYAKVPAGSQYYDSDGNLRVKPGLK